MKYKDKRIILFLVGFLIMVLINMFAYSKTLSDTFVVYGWNLIYIVILTLLVLLWDFRKPHEKLQDSYYSYKKEIFINDN